MDELQSLHQQIPKGTLLLGIDIAFGQDPQKQHLSQPECSMPIIGMLQTRVFLDVLPEIPDQFYWLLLPR